MIYTDIFLLTWKRVLIAIGVVVISVVLHNVISFLLNIEEVIFFSLGLFFIPLYLTLGVIYTSIENIKAWRKKKRKNTKRRKIKKKK